MKTVQFTQMKDGTREDYLLLREYENSYDAMMTDRVLRELASQEEDSLAGFKITRLAHALQSATRAYRDGVEIDWIVGALLHDLGDGLAPLNHDRFAAEVLRPFVREEVTWVVEHHAAFQLVYYGHHYGWNQHQREEYRGHPCFDSCVDFCERWDQSSFDPAYVCEPLSVFEPMVREVFARRAYDPQVIQTGRVTGLMPQKVATA